MPCPPPAGTAYRLRHGSGRRRGSSLNLFRFRTQIRNPATILYNTGPITDITSASWNRPQFYSVTRIARGHPPVLAKGLGALRPFTMAHLIPLAATAGVNGVWSTASRRTATIRVEGKGKKVAARLDWRG
ncbi:MAG TPA: hypothetical protein VHM65_00875 [Candidatus Lustribacter sp.]|nr:hypothetical protein [Candidatus Lustribacter sp.]